MAPNSDNTFRRNLASLGTILAKAASGDFIGAYGDARKPFDLPNVQNCPVEERWYYFWLEVFFLAILYAGSAKPVSFQMGQSKGDKEKEIYGYAIDIRVLANAALSGEGANEFTNEHLKYPETFPWAIAIGESLESLSSTNPTIRGIGETFMSYIGRAAREVWIERYSDLKDNMAAFDGPVALRAERDAAWRAHYKWLKQKTHIEPIFGQSEGHNISLSELYVPLRAHIECGDLSKRIVRVVNTHFYMRDWLAGNISRDPVRVISGGPGSGKSSFAKMLSYEVALRGDTDVIFIQLQHLSGSGTLLDQIERYMGDRPPGPAIKEPELLTSVRTKPLLIVFDGLDELARTDQAQIDLMRRFLERVNRLIDSIATPDSPVCAIVLGRTVAAQEAIRESQLDEKKHLQVAPFFPLEQIYFGDIGAEDIIDECNQRDEDQRLQYWERWANASGSTDTIPKHLTDDALHDLTGEPLLLYLLIITELLQSERSVEELNNRNAVYREIFQRVWHRDRKVKQHLAGQGITEEEFFILMESQGLAAWRGGGRTSSEKDYVAIRKLYAPAKHRVFKDIPGARLENVALQFFSREARGDSRGYEFIHKSFGEYMCARALVKLARSFCEKYHQGEEEKFFRDWMAICGHQTISDDLRNFIFLEFSDMTEESLKELQVGLEEICAQILSGSIITSVDAKPDQSIGAVAKSYLCLLGMLSAISRFHVLVKRDRHHQFTLRGGKGDVKRLIGLCQYVFASTDEFYTILNNVIIPEGSDLSHVSLSGANLRRSCLARVDFRRSNFDGSCFDESDLSQANLNHANFFKANFRLAKCQSSDFSYGNLTDTFWGQCDARGAFFNNSMILRADFSNADLSGAVFGEAHVYGAKFTRCRLHSADLSACHGLSQRQVDQAIGNAETKLPSGIIAPVEWSL